MRLGAKTARESAKSPDSQDSKLAPDDQNRFPGLTGRSSRLPEKRAREQETVNLSDNTRSAHSLGSGKLHYSDMKAILRVIYCVVAALGAVTVLSAQDVQTTWPVALAVALGTWLSASLITHHYAQRPARQDKPSIRAAAGAQTGEFPHGGDSRLTYAYIEESTWQWLQRNHLPGLPGRNSMELGPRWTLIATQPFAKPKGGEQLYDTKIELEIKGENKRGYYRFYRRGVFVGYDIPVPAYTTSA